MSQTSTTNVAVSLGSNNAGLLPNYYVREIEVLPSSVNYTSINATGKSLQNVSINLQIADEVALGRDLVLQFKQLQLRVEADPVGFKAGATTWITGMDDSAAANVSWSQLMLSKDLAFRSHHILNLIKNFSAELGTSGQTMALSQVDKITHFLSRIRNNEGPAVQASRLDRFPNYDMESLNSNGPVAINNSQYIKSFGNDENLFAGISNSDDTSSMRHTAFKCTEAGTNHFIVEFDLECSVPLPLFYGAAPDVQALFGLGSLNLTFEVDTTHAAKMFSCTSDVAFKGVRFTELSIHEGVKLSYSTCAPLPGYLSDMKRMHGGKIPSYIVPYDGLRHHMIQKKTVKSGTETVAWSGLVNIDRTPEAIMLRIARDVDAPSYASEYGVAVGSTDSLYALARTTNTNARITSVNVNINNKDVYFNEAQLYHIAVSYGFQGSIIDWRYLSGSVVILPMREIGKAGDISYIGDESKQTVSVTVNAIHNMTASVDNAAASVAEGAAQSYSFEALVVTPSQLEYTPEEGVRLSIGTNIAEGGIQISDIQASMVQKPRGLYMGGGFFSALGKIARGVQRGLGKGIEWISDPDNLKTAYNVIKKAVSEPSSGGRYFDGNVMGGRRGGAQVSEDSVYRNKLK